MPETTTHDGLALPRIGFGTAALKGQHGAETIAAALRTGYRLIDSAFNYENEGAVGAAVRSSGVPRDEVIVTSKLPGRHHAHDAAVAAVEESVYRTGLDHLDLLHPTRRLYKGRWENCRLATIERRALGIVREHDLPGSEAPGAWLGYLRGGSAALLREVVRHNHQDVVTLCRLLLHLAVPTINPP